MCRLRHELPPSRRVDLGSRPAPRRTRPTCHHAGASAASTPAMGPQRPCQAAESTPELDGRWTSPRVRLRAPPLSDLLETLSTGQQRAVLALTRRRRRSCVAEFRLLGPKLEASCRDDRPVALGRGTGSRGRCWRSLLLQCGNELCLARSHRPSTRSGAIGPWAREHSLDVQVSRLRKVFAPTRSSSREAVGYVLEVDPEQIDFTSVRALASMEGRRANAAGRPGGALTEFSKRLSRSGGQRWAIWPTRDFARAESNRPEELRSSVRLRSESTRNPALGGPDALYRRSWTRSRPRTPSRAVAQTADARLSARAGRQARGAPVRNGDHAQAPGE